MRMRSAAVISMTVIAVMLGGDLPASEAQQQPQRPAPRRPVRDPRQPPAVGTATIRGRVVDSVTGAAIPRAKVRTANRDRRSARVATTDTEGVFTLTRVTSGPLTLLVEKATYIAANYPERRRTMRNANLQVSDGQTIDNIVIPMSRGGAITGRVIDAYGDPVENVVMQAVPVLQRERSAPFNLRTARAFQPSNDIGEFRIGRLDPGQYYVLAMPARRQDSLEDGSSVPGRTWYPGVASIEQAQPITLERGGSLTGIDVQLLDTTLTKVSGVVLNAKGGPARSGHVSARRSTASSMLPRIIGGFTDGGGAGVNQDGSFELMLQPGEYILEGSAPQGEDGQRQGRFEMDRGQVRVMVSGESISGVTIAAGAGGAVSGRFVFKGTSAPPTGFGGFNIGFTGPNGIMAGDDCRTYNRATVNPDGTFSAENVWGTCQIRGGGMAKGWTFEAVMHNGNDITNRVIEFGTGRSISGVEIVYTDRIGEISVTVSDERGAPSEDYVAIVFPADKEKWGDQRFMRTQTMSPRTNLPPNAAPGYANTAIRSNNYDPTPVVTTEVFGGGASTVRNILAGDYFAVAVEDAAYEDLRDPEYLERLSQMATRVSLSPGETQTVQLRRVKAPE